MAKKQTAQRGRIVLDPEVLAGKPVVAFRTTTHAFNYPKGHELEKWNAFAADYLGGPPGCLFSPAGRCFGPAGVLSVAAGSVGRAQGDVGLFGGQQYLAVGGLGLDELAAHHQEEAQHLAPQPPLLVSRPGHEVVDS